MSDYTKGPWRVEADMRSNRIGDMWSPDGFEEYCAGYNIVAEDGTEIVGCEGIIDEDDTNARLMSAAPELLEALENLISEVLDVRGIDMEDYRPEAFKRARAAISKAKSPPDNVDDEGDLGGSRE